MREEEFEIVVMGAGSAGSAVAAFLAEAGLRVALVERRRMSDAGARWVNGIPHWMFSRAGVALPEAPERVDGDFELLSYSPTGQSSFRVNISPVWNVDMGLLVDRLQTRALTAGVVPFERASLLSVDSVDDRPVSVLIELGPQSTSQHRTLIKLKARLFVDATGLSQALLKRVTLRRYCPTPTGSELCTAAQQVFEIQDRDGVAEFLKLNRIASGNGIFWNGIEGGFSTLCLFMSQKLDHFSILTGTLYDGNYLLATQVAQRFLKAHSWVGPRISIGSGLIPIRAPYERFVSPGVALVGDAACQVFPLHGSGVGSGLIGARILADAVAGRSDPGDLIGLEHYQKEFWRELGDKHYAYDCLRRVIQKLSAEEMELLMRYKIISSVSYWAGLEQKMPSITASEMISLISGMLKVPRLGLRLAPALKPMLARMVRRMFGTHKAFQN